MKKEWYKSKTVWTAVYVGVRGVILALGIVIPPFVDQLAIAFGIYAVRDALG